MEWNDDEDGTLSFETLVDVSDVVYLTRPTTPRDASWLGEMSHPAPSAPNQNDNTETLKCSLLPSSCEIKSRKTQPGPVIAARRALLMKKRRRNISASQATFPTTHPLH